MTDLGRGMLFPDRWNIDPFADEPVHTDNRVRRCPVCGEREGECYNICPNSPHFYSPEQERADEAHYGQDDERERYAATIEPSQYADGDGPIVDPADFVANCLRCGTGACQQKCDEAGAATFGQPRPCPRRNTDDIPF